MNEKKARKWQARQKIGKIKFILIYGVLCYGIGVAVSQVLLRFIFYRSISSINIFDLIIIIIFGLLGGIYCGFKLWDNINYEIFKLEYLRKKE